MKRSKLLLPTKWQVDITRGHSMGTLFFKNQQTHTHTNTYHKTFHSAVVRVHHKLRESGEFGGPVPAITAMDKYISLLELQTPCNHSGSLERQ